MEHKYKLTLTEKQVRAIMHALELRFRIDLCQESDLAEILAAKNFDFSHDNPEHERLFSIFIERRDNIQKILKAVFEISKPFWEENKRDITALRCQDIWGVLRHQLWKDNPNKTTWSVDSRAPLKESDLELPIIESVDEDMSNAGNTPFQKIERIPEIAVDDRGKEYTNKCTCGGTITAYRESSSGHLRAWCNKCGFKLVE